jgi:hypothetical protein
LPKGIWQKKTNVYAGANYSHEGGTESLFCHRMDALQLAAHELEARPARDSPPGVHVVTAAGRDYFKMLKPFQKSPLAEWEDLACARAAIKIDIQARTDEIY